MLKNFSLLVVTIVSLFSMKSIYFNNDIKKSNTKEIRYSANTKEIVEEDINIDNIEPDIKVDNNKSNIIEKKSDINDIELLFKEATNLTDEEHYKKALEKYNHIINKLKNSNNIKKLKRFVGANFLKAYIYKTYLKDNESAIKVYNNIIDKFKDSSNVELLKFYAKAEKFKATMLNRDEAIYIYDEIADKFKESSNIELLKLYVNAQNAKATLSIDESDTIEIYDEIIDRLQDTKDMELLKELVDIEFSKAYLINNSDEAIELYDDIIQKLSPYSEFKDKVSDALFAKSYIIAKEDKEASMEILDKIIDKYRDNKNRGSSQNFEYAVINNIELALVTNRDDREYRELANQSLLDIKDTKPQLEMLQILKDAQDINQDEAMERWKDKYKNYKFDNWSFDTLKEWNNQMEDREERARIKTYINEFSKHSS